MSKKKNKDNKSDNREKNHGFKIPEDAKKLSKLSYKKYKKEYEDMYDSKKELKRSYYGYIVELLPASINLLVRYGHIEDVKETKDAIYEKITDPDFVKYLTKVIKNGDEFDNMIMLPNIILDIIKQANKYMEAQKQENGNAESVTFDMTDLVTLSSLILKKPMKKMEKAGIDVGIAFDTLSIIPTSKILSKSPYFHIRSLFGVLYDHAKDKDIPFAKLVKCLFGKDEAAIQTMIAFALLERKEKITNFNDKQNKLFSDITAYSLETLESMEKPVITEVLNAYVNARKKDAEANKDTNRRYYLSQLPKEDYPRITAVMNKMIAKNDDVKKFF